MTQPENSQLQALEDAIMKRAEELAQEFHDKANRQRDIILRDAAEHLQTAEERELMAIKDEAERHFHRVTQAGELKMQSRLDQLRWELVQTVQTRLTEHMKTFCDDRQGLPGLANEDGARCRRCVAGWRSGCRSQCGRSVVA